VIPGCNITLENVLLYVGRHTEGEEIDYEEASYLLGSYDNRTIRRHIEAAWLMIDEARRRDYGDAAAGGGTVGSEADSNRRPAARESARDDFDGPVPALEPMVVIHMVYVELAAAGAILPQASSSLNRDGPAPAICDTS
jgi:hypothetical protein